MGETCGTYGRWERFIQDFGGGRHLKERDHLENLGLDRRITLKCIFKKWDGGMDWIGLAQRRDRWRAFVDAVMNLRIL
jgi:predicted NBD/HSP70 family sugar kinase